jgi:hypothetical protein
MARSRSNPVAARHEMIAVMGIAGENFPGDQTFDLGIQKFSEVVRQGVDGEDKPQRPAARRATFLGALNPADHFLAESPPSTFP